MPVSLSVFVPQPESAAHRLACNGRLRSGFAPGGRLGWKDRLVVVRFAVCGGGAANPTETGQPSVALSAAEKGWAGAPAAWRSRLPCVHGCGRPLQPFRLLRLAQKLVADNDSAHKKECGGQKEQPLVQLILEARELRSVL